MADDITTENQNTAQDLTGHLIEQENISVDISGIVPEPEDSSKVMYPNNIQSDTSLVAAHARESTFTAQAANLVERVGLDMNFGYDQQSIVDNRDTLLSGVPESLHDFVLDNDNLLSAQAASRQIKQSLLDKDTIERAGLGENMLVEVGVIVADPMTWLAGGTGALASKMVVKDAGLTGLKAASATWATTGGVEEAIRLAPKLAADPMYDARQYVTDVALGTFVSGGIRGLGGSAVPLAKGIREGYQQSIEAYRNSLSLQTARNVAMSVPESSFWKNPKVVSVQKATDKLNKHIDTAKRTITQRVPRKDVIEAVQASVDGKGLSDSYLSAATNRIKAAVSARGGDTRLLDDVEFVDISYESLQKSMPDAKPSVVDEVWQQVQTYDTLSRLADHEVHLNKTNSLQQLNVELEGIEEAFMVGRRKVDAARREGKDVPFLAGTNRKTGEVWVNPDLDLNTFFKYFEGKADSPGSEQKKVILDRMADDGMSIENIRRLITTQEQMHQFLYLHEKSHVRNNDMATYNTRDLMGEPQLRMEQRANNDALSVMTRGASDRLKELSDVMSSIGVKAPNAKLLQDNILLVAESKVSKKIVDDWVTHQEIKLRDWLDVTPSSPERKLEYQDKVQELFAYINTTRQYVQNLHDNPRRTIDWSGIGEDFNTAEVSKLYDEASVLVTGARSSMGNLTQSFHTNLMKSDSNIAKWFAMNVLESPSGFGGLENRGVTASVLADTLMRQQTYEVDSAYRDLVRVWSDAQGLSRINPKRMHNAQVNPMRNADVRRLNEELIVLSNRMQWGETLPEPISDLDKAMRAFLKTTHDSYSKMHDLQVESLVDGMHKDNKIDNYMPQRWRIDQINQLILAGDTDNLKRLFVEAVKNNGTKDPEALAEALINHRVTQSQSRPSVGRLSDDIMSDDIGAIPGDKQTFAYSRVKMDYTASIQRADGSTIRLLDLLDTDVPGSHTKYTKEATARAAISQSTGGVLNGNAAFDEMIDAIAEESVRVGTPVDTRDIQNTLRQMLGYSYEGQLNKNLRYLRDATALSNMGGFGESQLAELGIALTRGVSGLTGAIMTGKSRLARLQGITDGNRELLKSYQQVSGLLEDSYLVVRHGVNFDENSSPSSRLIDSLTGGQYRDTAKHVQDRITGAGALRTWEEQIAMAGFMDDLFKYMNGKDNFTSIERMRDSGILDEGDNLDWIKKYMDDGTILMEDGYVQNLNLDSWTSADRTRLGVVLNRHAGQAVQRSFAGEQAPELANPVISFLLQFKSYQLQAVEKQTVRDLQFADKEAAIKLMANAITSGISRYIRIQSLQLANEDYTVEDKDFIEQTLAYSAHGGVLDMYRQIADTTAGTIQGDLSVGQALFNGFNNPIIPPSVGYTTSYINVADNLAEGESVEKQLDGISKWMMLGTTAPLNALHGLLDDLIGEEDE